MFLLLTTLVSIILSLELFHRVLEKKKMRPITKKKKKKKKKKPEIVLVACFFLLFANKVCDTGILGI